MTGGRAPWRREALWAALLLVVAVLGPGYAPPRPEPGADTWSVRPGGKKVVFALAQRLWGGAWRNTTGLLPPPDAALLCQLGPARYPDASEWRRLHAWVTEGHVLVFAPRRDDPAVDLGPFGLRVRRAGGATALEADAALAAPLPPATRWSGAVLEGARPDAWVALRAGGRPAALVQREGRGLLVAVASDEIFENAWLLRRAQSLVGLHLLERARVVPGQVYFDEWLSAGGTRIFGLLFSAAVRPVTLQLVALGVLFGWSGCRCFGAPLPRARAARRSVAEHAVALGRWHQRAGTGAALVAAYLEYFGHRLGLARRAALGEEAAQLVARRTRQEPRRVRDALQRAAQQAAARPGGAEAAGVIRDLAEIQAAAHVKRGHRWN